MSDDKTNFWCVWDPEHGTPTVRHETRDKAQQEAMRLARLNPGRRFFVLRAVAFVEKIDVRLVELTDASDLPW